MLHRCVPLSFFVVVAPYCFPLLLPAFVATDGIRSENLLPYYWAHYFPDIYLGLYIFFSLPPRRNLPVKPRAGLEITFYNIC